MNRLAVISFPFLMLSWELDAIIIYSIVALTIIIICIRLFIRRKQQKIAEGKVAFFISTANTLHLPLLEIKNRLKEISEKETLSKKGQQEIETIQNNIKLLLHLSNDLMNFEWIAMHADNNDERAFIANVRDQIEQHITEPDFNVDKLCSELHMSRTSFYNKIKQLTDKAPGDYIRLIRLKRAALLLESHRHSITEVAELTGFNDAKYFREVFKKHYGMTPREYATQEHKKKATDER